MNRWLNQETIDDFKINRLRPMASRGMNSAERGFCLGFAVAVFIWMIFKN